MNAGQEYEWNIELDHMRAQLRFALNNLDDIKERDRVRHMMESVYVRLVELCEATEGESK